MNKTDTLNLNVSCLHHQTKEFRHTCTQSHKRMLMANLYTRWLALKSTKTRTEIKICSMLSQEKVYSSFTFQEVIIEQQSSCSKTKEEMVTMKLVQYFKAPINYSNLLHYLASKMTIQTFEQYYKILNLLKKSQNNQQNL